MTTLKYKEVRTKKPHVCFSCIRKFDIGNKMFYWVCVDDDGISTGYNCKTCDEIITLSKETDITYGFVFEWLNKGQTAEDLLESLKNKNK